MGYIIGTGTFPSTWLSMRAIVSATIPPPPFPAPTPTFADHNQEWPISLQFLKTIEGNGLVRISPPAVSLPIFLFYPQDAPFEDYFNASNFPEPYPELLIGRTVSTAGSSFSITAAAFEPEGQTAGTGGDPPISVEWFEAIT